MPSRLTDPRTLQVLAALVVVLAVLQIIVASPVVGVPLALISILFFVLVGRQLGWDRLGTGVKAAGVLFAVFVVLLLVGGDDRPMALAVLTQLVGTALLACLGLLAWRLVRGPGADAGGRPPRSSRHS